MIFIHGNGSIDGATNLYGATHIWAPTDNTKLTIRRNDNINPVLEVAQGSNGVYAKMTFKSGGFTPWELGGPGTGVNGDSYFKFIYNGLNALTLSGLGTLTIAGTVTENSDIRLKKNIAPINDALHKVLQLRGVTYNWIDTKRDSAQQIGFIAQEVEKVFPQLVKTDEQGIKSVVYSNVVPILLQAINEQQQMIEELRTANNKVKSLEERVEKLHQTMNSIISSAKK